MVRSKSPRALPSTLLFYQKRRNVPSDFFLDQDVNWIFSLPLSTQATNQLEEVQTLIEQRTWNVDTKDIWCYSWGSCKYRSKKAYKILIGHTETSPLFNWMWASNNLGKHKFFFWLLLRDRINTRNLLRRKNMDLQNYNCVLCNSDGEETSMHLFFWMPLQYSMLEQHPYMLEPKFATFRYDYWCQNILWKSNF